MRAKSKRGAVHWITRISIVGITVTTAALVILLSAFNGIEGLVEKLYSDFDADITILPVERKTFFSNEIDFNAIRSNSSVQTVLPYIEEVILLKHEKKWANAQLYGVEDSFLILTNLSAGEHLVDGYPVLSENGNPRAIVGASLLDKLEAFVPKHGLETLLMYAPKRQIKMRIGTSPFRTSQIGVSARMNFNREVNQSGILIPLEEARRLLGYKPTECSGYHISIDEKADSENVKAELQAAIGDTFKVRTRYEKNELIYKTSQSEKVVVVIILLFVFVIAAFTLVAALTMLFIEKKDNFKTLIAIGATRSFQFRIILLEGILISMKGVIIGLILGYAICFLQLKANLLIMPNSYDEPFPIVLKWLDAGFILGMVTLLSFAASYLPAKFLVRSKK